MISLIEQRVYQILDQNLPTKTGTLVFVTNPKKVSLVANTLAVSLPEGSHFEGGAWRTPGGDKILVRSSQEPVPEGLSYDLAVCCEGEALSPEDVSRLKTWRSQCACAR